METLDVALLSRLQFALTISFHIIFPTITIGLAYFLAITEWRWLKTKDPMYMTLLRFWSKIFALTFGMGVVSGLVLSYEFGTNFSEFSRITGPVLGPLMAYEVLTAFFLEAGFLGVMLFGWNKVGPRLHFASTVIVMMGTTISSFWILAANSWMQTPQGATLVDGVFQVDSWMQVIFNPSFPYRLAHMLSASFVSVAFILAGVAAYWLISIKKSEQKSEQMANDPETVKQNTSLKQMAKKQLRFAMIAATVMVPLQITIGDLHGLNVLEHQPMKVAAMEGIWETDTGVDMLLFAIPDQANQTNKFEIAIPNLASVILTHDVDGELKGLNEVPVADQPNVPVVFYSFRVMVGIGFGMFGLVFLFWLLSIKKRHFSQPIFLRLLVLFAPMGIVATLAGWFVAEVGRQPWLVYGLIRTKDVVSPGIQSEQVLFTLIMFAIIYGILLVVYTGVLLKILAKGPKPLTPNTHSDTLEPRFVHQDSFATNKQTEEGK
jgi:cytochrome bd ubiquinol oxidase subunit I